MSEQLTPQAVHAQAIRDTLEANDLSATTGTNYNAAKVVVRDCRSERAKQLVHYLIERYHKGIRYRTASYGAYYVVEVL